MKLVVCGGRDFKNQRLVNEVMGRLAGLVQLEWVITCDAHGVDSLVEQWCENTGQPVLKVPALWRFHKGRAADYRNEAVLRLKPDMVLVFPGKAGSSGVSRLAASKGLPVLVVQEDGKVVDGGIEGLPPA